ncbi:MAG: hypothetical protein ACFFE1_17670 [Candidatus Thorarchaeota archaeon]
MAVSMPLFSGTFYEAYSIGGFLWGLLLDFIALFYGITFDFLQWVFLTLACGFFLQLLLNGLKMRRFRNPVTNPELLALFEEVKSDFGIGEGIQLWIRDVDRAIFLSSVTPLFKAILFSGSTIGDILRNPEKGKIVLAQEVLKMEQLSPQSRMAIGLFAFTFFSILESFSLIGYSISFTMTFGPLVLVILVIALLAIIAGVPYFTSRTGRNIELEIAKVYDTPYAIAASEVLHGFQLPDEVVDEIKRDEREGKPTRGARTSKNGLIAAVIAMPVTFIIMFMLAPTSPLIVMFAVVMAAAVGFFVFLLTLLISEFSVLRKSMKIRRSTVWDFQNSFSNDVQSILNKCPGYDEVIIRAVKSSSNDQIGLVAVKLTTNMEEETLFAMLPRMVQDLHDVELAGPFILSELRRNDIEKRFNRLNYAVLGITIPFLTIGVIASIANQEFYSMFDSIIPIFVTYIVMSVVPGIGLSIWKCNADIKSDTEIARAYPRLREALQTLIANHHTLPFGKTSYKSRLERIDKQLGVFQV